MRFKADNYKLMSLFFGDYHVFAPKIPAEDKNYDREVLERMNIFFGPFPTGFKDPLDQTILDHIANLRDSVPESELQRFQYAINKEIESEDKTFLFKIMKLDPRERPTAKELLKDNWLSQEST
jgi:serine/threonine protein kinase